MQHFLLIPLAPFVCLSLQAQTPAPTIAFDSTHHDFGKISEDHKTAHRFIVTNKGNASLNIKEVRTSCDCTNTTVGKTTLLPDEGTFIEAHFDPAGLMGNVRRTLDVVSDDQANPVTRLTFDATVIREIMPSGNAVVFEKVRRDGVGLASSASSLATTRR